MARIKMTIQDLYHIGVEYFASARVTNKNTGERGYRFILEKPLTAEQVEYISKFKNVILSDCYFKYAPEIKHPTILLLDKCRKGEKLNV